MVTAITNMVIAYCDKLRKVGMVTGDALAHGTVDAYVRCCTREVVQGSTVADVLHMYEHYMYDIKRINHPHALERVIEWMCTEARLNIRRKCGRRVQ